MFWTAFVWGVGVSCGAAIGLLGFMFAKTAADWALGHRKMQQTILTYNQLSLVELTNRNVLTLDTIEALERIAAAVEHTDD